MSDKQITPVDALNRVIDLANMSTWSEPADLPGFIEEMKKYAEQGIQAASQPPAVKGGMPPLDKPTLTDEDMKAWEQSEAEERTVKGAVWVKGEYELAFIPCASDDPRRIGAYQSTDGESEFSVRELHLPVEPKGAVWVKASDRLPKSWNRLCARFIHTKIPLCAPETWISENERAVQDIEWLDESPTAAGDGKPTSWGPDEYPDLSSCTAEQKHDTIFGLIQIAAREIMRMFYAFGLKTHIECKVVNEPTNETFEFSFVKVGAGDGKEAIEFADWIAVQGYRHLDNGVWAQEGIVNSLTTTAQLYDIFKQQNK